MTRWCVALSACWVSACRPSFEEASTLVTFARVLAVKSEPAEAKPGTPLVFSALVAAPPSQSNAPLPSWSFCSAPKPVTENNVVSTECLNHAALVHVGEGTSVTAATPLDACTVFGPNTPSSGYRPRDPDATGGYFQPLRVDLPGAEPTFHLQRVRCNLADASSDIATEFGLTYVSNENPHLLPLVATSAGQRIAFDAVPSAARVELTTGWAAADAETYAYFDRLAQVVTSRREAMRVAWYASAGALDAEATGRAEDDSALDASDVWTAPREPGPATLWLVLRDSRGGVDFATYQVRVLP